MISPAPKHSEAENTKSCGYPSACQVPKASPATKPSEVYHQVESLEAPKRPSGVVIIHQAGTVNLAYNKSGVTVLSASINKLKLVGHTRGQVG